MLFTSPWSHSISCVVVVSLLQLVNMLDVVDDAWLLAEGQRLAVGIDASISPHYYDAQRHDTHNDDYPRGLRGMTLNVDVQCTMFWLAARAAHLLEAVTGQFRVISRTVNGYKSTWLVHYSDTDWMSISEFKFSNFVLSGSLWISFPYPGYKTSEDIGPSDIFLV